MQPPIDVRGLEERDIDGIVSAFAAVGFTFEGPRALISAHPRLPSIPRSVFP